MSGIAGSYGFGADTEGIARRMSGALAHRGPDGEHLVVVEHAGLVHRRLDVPDRESGAQPMTSEDGRYTLVHDGALHNRTELRAELEDLGHLFRTAADAEVVLAAHAQWGTAAYERFEGRFVLALHDARTGTLTLARDVFGIAPLYYWIDQDADPAELPRLLFGSEIRALLAAERFTPAADDRAVFRYLTLHLQDDEPETFFEGVRRLLPGQLLQIGPEGLETRSVTDLEEELRRLAAGPRRPYDQQAVSEFRELFDDAVRRHLPATGPVGTSLSGDLGSEAVAARIAHRQRGEDAAPDGPRQHAFAAPLPEAAQHRLEALRSHYPGQVAAHAVRLRPTAVLEDLREVLRTQEEPLGSTAEWADYAVVREARDQVGVLLGGAGAAEMLAGSPAHAAVLRRQLRTQKRFKELGGALLGSLPRRGERPVALASVPIEALLNSAFVAAHSAEQDGAVQDDLTQRRLQDVFRATLPAQLRGQDKNAARFGLEARQPFLDRRLLRFLVAVEDSALLSGGTDQRILRDALDGVLPEQAAAPRAASTSSAAEGQWLRPVAAEVREIFASESFANRPYVDAPTVVALLDDVIAHPERHRTDMFWRLLNLELWMRTFLDDPAGAGRPLGDQAAAEQQPSPAVAGAAEEPDPAAELEEPKSDYVANPGKQLDLLSEADGHRWRRLPLQTELVGRGDDIEALVRARVERFAADLPADAVPAGAPWYLVISEKIVAITQGRSWFTWEVAPRPAARVLSRFVTRTPAGIGLGDPTTMELAIREVGLPRVLAASVVGAAGKLMGKRGLFYEVVGANVRAIDGPTPYSAFPSNVSAKLPPKDPDAVSARISAALRGADLPPALRESFVGTVVMDANDIGRNVLGSDVDTSAARLEATFADNPLGQGRQRTPLAILVDLGPVAQR